MAKLAVAVTRTCFFWVLCVFFLLLTKGSEALSQAQEMGKGA